MKYVAYEKYKFSGTEWLGNVPAHWEVSPLKYAAIIKTGYAFSSDEFTDEGIPVLRISDITKEGMVDLSNAKYLPIENAIAFGAVTLKKDDIVMAMTGATIGKAGRYESNKPCLLNQRVCAFKTTKDNHQTFLWYLLNADFFNKHIALTAFGGAQPNISDTQLLACDAPLPPLEEQQTIARFLNAKTAQIDELIAKKHQLIDKLKEKRQALIARTVTRGLPPEAAKAAGLEPNVEMRDSGVEWLGEIPAHWKAKAARYIFRNCNFRRIPLSSEERAGLEKIYPYYGASGVIDMVDDYLFDEPLVLVAEDGANLLSRSTPLAFLATGKYWVNNHAHILKPIAGDIRYWVATLETFDFSPLITGSAQPKLTADRLGGIRLPAPPRAEQTAIADYLATKTAELDALVSQAVEVANRLTEYRQALITSAVTGKIDVRGLV